MVDAGEVVVQVGFKVPAAIEFCEELLTGVNAHTISYILTALRLERYDEAGRLVQILKLMEHGPLFGPRAEKIAVERKALFDRLDADSDERNKI